VTPGDLVKRFDGSDRFSTEALPAPAVAIGNFDGVHLGHRALIGRAMEEAQRSGGASVVLTFEPHPVRILSPAQCPQLITTLEQKLRLIEGLGVDAAVVEPFTRDYARMMPQEFFERILVGRLGARAIVVGYDFTFGLHRQGTVETLEEHGRESGVRVAVVPAHFSGETLVSSNLIRRMISEGDVEGARRLLGHPYEMTGRVVPGRGFGRSLAARTANIEPESEMTPRDGVYVTRAFASNGGRRRGEPLAAVTSIGENPTFPGQARTIETHVLGGEVELAGMRLSLEFMARLRDQARFDSQDELREQIARDIEAAGEYHRRMHGGGAP
jgi:riboflavin kinase/FMN adenylyltransferase